MTLLKLVRLFFTGSEIVCTALPQVTVTEIDPVVWTGQKHVLYGFENNSEVTVSFRESQDIFSSEIFACFKNNLSR